MCWRFSIRKWRKCGRPLRRRAMPSGAENWKLSAGDKGVCQRAKIMALRRMVMITMILPNAAGSIFALE